ncbi:MAG TPA: hypothetical protein VGG26_01005 [Terracidiphilus sp.]|jgi:hypothetical protein
MAVLRSAAHAGTAPPVRGTQLLVEHMSVVAQRPTLLLLEIAWRWLAGIPIAFVFWKELQQILAQYSLAASGFTSIDAQNPWVAVVQISGVWTYYEPHIAALLRWLLPVAAAFWILVSGVGRNLVLMRMEPGLPFRPIAIIGLQAAWMGTLTLTFWGWFRSVQWDAATHIPASGGEPDLVGYAMWAIFLSLGFFTVWALASWALSIAPLLVLLERLSAFSALKESLNLGKGFTGKLAEINLVMGIVKISLIVLAMVFSAAPLPFADEVGGAALHMAWTASAVFFLIASDYFQVVRLKAFVEFWRIFRSHGPAA